VYVEKHKALEKEVTIRIRIYSSLRSFI